VSVFHPTHQSNHAHTSFPFLLFSLLQLKKAFPTTSRQTSKQSEENLKLLEKHKIERFRIRETKIIFYSFGVVNPTFFHALFPK